MGERIADRVFTQDWFSHHTPLWRTLLAPWRGREVHALEIGVFEGLSSVWLLDNILTHPSSSLTYVDTFEPPFSLQGVDFTDLETRFRNNVRDYAKKVRGHRGTSQDYLKFLKNDSFDFIYVDGSHMACDVLSDAVLSWPLLKPDGLMAFDDYQWKFFVDQPMRHPRLGIDAFLHGMQGHYRLLHKGDQVWIRKQPVAPGST